MQKHRINQDYLDKILARGVRNSELDVLCLTDSLLRFTKQYLEGVMLLDIKGTRNGYVTLNLRVFSYLLRLLYEEVEDDPVECAVTIDDDFIIETSYPKIKDHEMTSHLISVASLVGFKVDRRGDTLIFRAKITPSHLFKIYATSTDEIMDWLVLTYRM